MTNLGKITAMHVRMDRLFGHGAFDEDAAEYRSQSELSAVLYAALVGLLVIACMVIAATGVLAS